MSIMFDTVQVGDMPVRNRFVHSATHEVLAETDGRVTEEIVRRYETLAKGEVGLIIPGHMFVHPSGRAHPRQSGIYCDEMIPGLCRLTDAVHAHGGKVAVQLAHGGRQSPKKVLGTQPLAPSGHGRDPVTMNKPRQMTREIIRETVQAFIDAARRAAEAGADAVQLHGAHGYLICEFLSPFYNRRRDEYGGSAEGRFRFLREIVTGVRSVLPDTMPVLVKMNGNDYTPRTGVTPDLAARYAAWLVDMGVAAVEVSGGTYYGFQSVRGEIPIPELVQTLPAWMRPIARIKMHFEKSKSRFAEAYNLEAAKTIRPATGTATLILVGGMRSLSKMEEIVSAGHADMISMSRPFIREPLLVKKFREGKKTEADCISCNMCSAAMFNEIPVRCYRKGLPAVFRA
ncbi:MAG: NADH:flavin oxidoreductase [Desulfobacterales bacterium]|nr:NADH:flavin oxidoreductase [Desulfobacterales bacterium]